MSAMTLQDRVRRIADSGARMAGLAKAAFGAESPRAQDRAWEDYDVEVQTLHGLVCTAKAQEDLARLARLAKMPPHLAGEDGPQNSDIGGGL